MVYLIGNRKAGVCKIGYSAEPLVRLNQLQTGCPYHLELLGAIEGDVTTEKEFHEQFADVRMKGEWFTYSDTIGSIFGVEPSYLGVSKEALSVLTGSGTSLALLMLLGRDMDWTNKVKVTGPKRRELAQELNIKPGTVAKALEMLVESTALVRLERGVYQLNPAMFFKG